MTKGPPCECGHRGEVEQRRSQKRETSARNGLMKVWRLHWISRERNQEEAGPEEGMKSGLNFLLSSAAIRKFLG